MNITISKSYNTISKNYNTISKSYNTFLNNSCWSFNLSHKIKSAL